MAWWDFNQCKGKKKDGARCIKSARAAVELYSGGLRFYYTCHIHADQENTVRKRIGLPLLKDDHG